MGISMVSIMLYHQNWITNGIFFEWVRMLGYIGVEVFLFISGFGIAHSLAKNSLGQYYKNRVIRLIPACILFGLCKIALSYIPTMPPMQDFFLDLFSLSHWYIYAIVIYYLLAPVIYKIIDKRGGIAFLAIIIATYITICFWQYEADAPYLIKYGRWVVKRFPVFVFGMFIAIRPLRFGIYKVVLLGVLATLANVGVFHYTILANSDPTSHDFFTKLAILLPDRSVIPDNGRFILDMFNVLLLIPLFALIAFLMNKSHILFIINRIGKYSLEIYLCHQYIFTVISEHFAMPPMAALAVGMCLSFAMAYLIGTTASSIKTFATRYI